MNRRQFMQSLGVAAGAMAVSTPLGWLRDADTLDATLAVGDVITIDGVFALNPLTTLPLAHLQQFVVREVAHDGTVELYPTPPKWTHHEPRMRVGA